MGREISMVAVGDIILSREDPEAVFRHSAAMIAEADIAFFNCETPYAESGSAGMGLSGAVPHNPRNLPAIGKAGFNVCTLANNHTLDWGVDAVVECRQRLEDMGIAVCGAGRNISEARRPAIVERDGTRIAFLGYCCVGPNGVLAEENKPGAAMVRARTFYEPIDNQPGTPDTRVFTFPYEADLQAMTEDITRAKEVADIVVTTFHWGVHFVPVLIPDYELTVGHAAVDAGADLVLGHHPHILKGIEVYKGRVIMHSMSHFILDVVPRPDETVHDDRINSPEYHGLVRKLYEWGHPDQRKTVIVKCRIEAKQIREVSYLPIMLDEYWSDPEPLPSDDPRSRDISLYVEEITKRANFDTEFVYVGDDVLIKTQ